MVKKQESAIGYRPSPEIKNLFEKICVGSGAITRPQLIEVAMQFLYAQGEERMREIMQKILLGEGLASYIATPKKGEHRKAG